jgi:hypothetical protein
VEYLRYVELGRECGLRRIRREPAFTDSLSPRAADAIGVATSASDAVPRIRCSPESVRRSCAAAALHPRG